MSPTEVHHLEQRRAAIKLATATREEKASLKRALKAGRASLAQALHAGCTQSASIESILQCLPSFGPMKTTKVLKLAGVSHYRKVRTLTEPERERLLELA